MKQAPSTRKGRNGAAAGLRVLVLRSRFNETVVGGLARGAAEYLGEAGSVFDVEEAPGAFELPLLAQTAAFTGRWDAIVALGAVIKGETDHYEHIAGEAARGIMHATLTTGVPIAFGVLTVRKAAHALSRSRPGPHNKGREAAAAAVETALALRRMHTGSPKPSKGGR